MTAIRINTDQVRDAGRQLLSAGDRLAQIGAELQSAMGSLDTWAWDGQSRWEMEGTLSGVRPASEAVAQGLDELGRKLYHVADTFEQEDATAAQNLEGMPWVEWKNGSEPELQTQDQNIGTSFEGNRRWWSLELGGEAGISTSYDLSDQKRETKKEAEVKLKVIEGALYDAEDNVGDVRVGGVDIGGYRTDAKAGMYEAGAKVGFGEDGFTAGAYGEVSASEVTAEGVIGTSAFGIAGVVGAAGPSAEAFIGIKDNTLGASIGGSIVSAEAEAGLNIAGANVGIKGGVSLGLEFGFKIGQKTEVKFGPFKVGLAFGKAKG